MFARKIQVEYLDGEKFVRCPLKWLDNFSMRSFTNASIFDDTMPVEDGVMEIGRKVPEEELRGAMTDWFLRKGYIKPSSSLRFGDRRDR